MLSSSISQSSSYEHTILNLKEALTEQLGGKRDRSDHSNSSSGSSVSFSPCIEIVQTTLCREDYDESERAATWYNPLEIKSFRKERRRVVQRLEAGDDVECPRGVESQTQEGLRQRQMAIMNAVSAVLNEQEEQMIHSFGDQEALAQVYRAITRESQKLAVERAVQDRQALEV